MASRPRRGSDRGKRRRRRCHDAAVVRQNFAESFWVTPGDGERANAPRAMATDRPAFRIGGDVVLASDDVRDDLIEQKTAVSVAQCVVLRASQRLHESTWCASRVGSGQSAPRSRVSPRETLFAVRGRPLVARPRGWARRGRPGYSQAVLTRMKQTALADKSA